MVTTYNDIYKKFITMFQDKKLSALTPPTLEELFEMWLDESINIHFLSCKKNLNDRNETTKTFNIELTSTEQWILAYGLQVSWANSKMADSTKLQNRFNDRDFSTFAPSTLLSALTKFVELTEKRLTRAKNKYQRFKHSNFSYLS